MNKLKISIYLMGIGFAGLIFYQNRGYLLTPARLRLNLGIVEPFESNGVTNIMVIVAFLLIGFLSSYISFLYLRYKTTKTIHNLNDTISSLKSELDSTRPTELEHESAQSSDRPADNI